MANDLTKGIISSLEAEVLNALELCKSIGHMGELGRAKENVIRNFLRRIIPSNLGLDTGFVIDSMGSISRQIDIVIYRADYYPVFQVGDVKHFVVESVVAVVENKSSIGSNERLEEAVVNVASAKKLDRTSGGRNYILPRKEKVDPGSFEHQIFGAVLTESSMTKTHLKRSYPTILAKEERMYWPNCYVDIRTPQYISYGKADASTTIPTIKPSEAEYLLFCGDDQKSEVTPLRMFAFDLLNFLRVAARIDYRATGYLDNRMQGVEYVKLL